MLIETQIKLDLFKPRPYQEPIFDAIVNKGYRRVIAVLPRRAGKDIACWNLMIRMALKTVGVYFMVYPTYSQGRKILWDSLTNAGARFLDYIPTELIEGMNQQEMKIRLVNGSLLQVVGSDNYSCFDDKTEILTDEGWKFFKDLKQGDLVASLVDGYMKFVNYSNYVEEFYDSSINGKMIACSNTSIDFLVTPNHRFWVKSGKGFYKFKLAGDKTLKGYSIPSQCLWEGDDRDVFVFPEITSKWVTGKGRLVIKEYRRQMPMEEFVALLGIFLAEGSTYKDYKTYRVSISQIKEGIKQEIFNLLKRNNINYCYSHGNISIQDQQLYVYFSQFGLQHDRFIPKEIKNLSPKYLKILFDWLVKGDGHACKEYTAYYSTSKRLIDDVQEIVLKIGRSGSIYEKRQAPSKIKGREINSQRICYAFYVRKSRFKFFSSSKKNYIHEQEYKGNVYCVSVPSGVIKVRRNGREHWSGNSLVGTNPRGCVFSEYALQDPRAYQFLRPALTAIDGWAIFISTPRGRNSLYELYQIAVNNPTDWFAYRLTVEDTGHIPLHEIEREKASGEMSEDLIMQEYFCSWDLGVEGSYYSKVLNKMRLDGRIGVVPHEHGFKVHTAWDLGVHDKTCIGFFQVVGQVVRVIDYYENSDKGLDHYAKILNSKDYLYGKHFAPHDIAVRELSTGLARIDLAKNLGINFTIVPNLPIEDGIESVRAALSSKIWIDETNCAGLLKALESYRREYDSKRKVYKDHALHDWASDPSDMFRYLCLSLPKTRDGLSPEDLDRRYQQAMGGDRNANMPSIFRDDLPPY